MKRFEISVNERNEELRRIADAMSLVALPTDQAAAVDFESVCRALTFDNIAGEWRAAQVDVLVDPKRAVLSACRMVETVCRHIIESKGEVSPNELAMQLRTARKLLTFDTDPLVDENVKVIVGNFGAVSHAIGTIRNHASVAHGAGITPPQISPQLAKFVVNTAGPLVTFLLDRFVQLKGAPSA